MSNEDVSSASSEASSSKPTNGKRARVSEGSDDEELEEANDDFAPGGDADYFIEDDAEGGQSKISARSASCVLTKRDRSVLWWWSYFGAKANYPDIGYGYEC